LRLRVAILRNRSGKSMPEWAKFAAFARSDTCICSATKLTLTRGPSNQPDMQILVHVQVAQMICYIGVGLIGAAIISGWLFPGFGALLPHGWSVMKANTAVSFLFCIASLGLTQAKRSRTRNIQGQVLAVLVMVTAGAALFAYSTGRPIGLDTILVADKGAETPGRMSVQTAVYLELVGLILLFESASRRILIHFTDALTMTLVLLILSVFAGYAFDAADLFGQSTYTRVSPQTLVCMVLLGIALVGRRTRDGFFSVLVGGAIGSQTARVSLPFALVLPFMVVSGSAYATRAHWLSTPYAAALAASFCSVVIFAFVVLMARRINDLERELRDMSLVDELTRIHNRRAFYLLGENALGEARRSNKPLTVLYFDLNGLKKVNDTLGHETGSRLLVEAANLLSANFRSSDVVARLGGDEFAIVTRNSRNELIAALTRLDDATAKANQLAGRTYRISYSMGEATVEPTSEESFADLVERADVMMYGRKRQRMADRRAASADSGGENFAANSMATGVLAAYVAQKDRR
jgi:diguanylate cyclase (GGDEF)-like protein